MRPLLASLLLCWAAVSVPAFAQDENVRFSAVDIYLVSEEPVAAWQFELSDRRGLMKVVGVEKGESAAYTRTPYYDREAVRLGSTDRIIVADYSLADANSLPSGRTRIATVHLMLGGDSDAELDLRLVTATGYDGREANASINFEERPGSEQ